MVAAWIILSMVGLVFAAVDAVSAFNRWQLAVVAVPEDERLIDLARSTMMSQLANFVQFGILLLIGLLATTSYMATWFPILMFSLNGILVISTIQEHRFRKRMYGEG